MRRFAMVLLGAALLIAAGGLLLAQEPAKTGQEEARPALRSQVPSYEPAGRRDPFKNLLAGKEIKEKSQAGATPQLYIDDVNLIGIVKYKNKYTAILSGPQGFPYYFEVGDKLSDGFILAINENQVVFRKTNERGIPLTRPKDIVKEIKPEER
jgi:Tfp pilus assembly protein PilP